MTLGSSPSEFELIANLTLCHGGLAAGQTMLALIGSDSI